MGNDDDRQIDETARSQLRGVCKGREALTLLLARDLKAGVVGVNAYSEGDMTTPFGGYKLSGFGGHDKSVHAHDQYTETKTIWIALKPAP